MSDAKMDANSRATLTAVSSVDGVSIVKLYADPTTHRLLVDSAGGGSGLTVGTTKITSGTTTRILFDNAGVLGEYVISGTGNVAMTTSPAFTTPSLGVATATSINGNTFTAGSYTLTGTAAKTLNFTNSITLSGTDGTTMTFPSTSATIARTDAANTFTGTQTIGALVATSINGNTITAGSSTYTGAAAATYTFPGASKTIAANDGSNWTIASQAIGDIAVASSTTAYSRLAAVAVGQVLVSAGTGTAPAYSANPQVTTLEIGNASDTTLARVSAGVASIEGATIGTLSTAQTWTATQTEKLVLYTQNSITASGNAATVPVTHRYNVVTNNSAATLTVTMTTASAVNGQLCMVEILDFSAAAQTITWVNTENSTVSAPTTSNGSTTLPLTVGFKYNSATSKWRCIASA